MQQQIKNGNGPVLLALAALLAALAAWLVLAPATAQRRPSDLELLVRTTVHEAGWEDTGDMEAIYAVLAGGAEREGVPFGTFARLYSPRLHTGDVSRRWASELEPSCAAPPSWPRFTYRRGRDGLVLVSPHAPWSAYRDRCLEVVARARAVLAGERVHRCEAAPHDWGSPVLDRERAERLGLIPVSCGEATRNDYYLRPSLL